MEEFTTLRKLAKHERYIEAAKRCYARLKSNKKIISTGDVECWRALSRDGKPLASNNSGYIQRTVVQPSGHQRRQGVRSGPTIVAYIHQLGWWSGMRFQKRYPRRYYRRVLRGRSITVSHLCHNKWCFRPSHLVAEPRWVNIYREGCRLRRTPTGNCMCHRSRDGIVNKYQPCLL